MLRNIITCIAECAYECPCSSVGQSTCTEEASDEARGILTKTKPRVKLEHTLATANIDRTCTRYA